MVPKNKFTIMKNRGLWFALMCMLNINVYGQIEPMFTQYMLNETFINPAYAGSHDNLAGTLLHRDQWTGFAGSPRTQTLSLHAPVANKKLGVGLSILNESIGVTKQNMIVADVAYRIKMESGTLAFGLQGGILNQNINFSEVKTVTEGDQQFMNDFHKSFIPNAGFGFYYYTKTFYAGLSVPRVVENKINPSSPDQIINSASFGIWHYYITSGYVFDVSDNIKCKPSVMIKTLLNTPSELDGNVNFIFNNTFWLGTGYRTGDAVSAMIALQLSNKCRIGYSYDYTLSELQKYNSGTHEFSISYEFYTLKNRIYSPRYF
jgi:type IX secretion system PorP/SprF family membrane protein